MEEIFHNESLLPNSLKNFQLANISYCTSFHLLVNKNVRGYSKTTVLFQCMRSNIYHVYSQVVFPALGGPMMAILIGTTGLGEGCFRYLAGNCMKLSRASSLEQKYTYWRYTTGYDGIPGPNWGCIHSPSRSYWKICNCYPVC